MVESKHSILDDDDDTSNQEHSENGRILHQTTFELEKNNDDVFENRMAKKEKNRVFGAGIIGGILVTVVGGPILGIIAGFGVAYYAKKKDGGAAGDVARAMGDVALIAKDKAEEIDKKHHLVDKSSQATKNIINKAKKLARDEHSICDKTKEMLTSTWASMVQYNNEHHVLERTSESICVVFAWLIDKMRQQIAVDNSNKGNNNLSKIRTIPTPQVDVIEEPTPTNNDGERHPTPTAPPADFDENSSVSSYNNNVPKSGIFFPPKNEKRGELRKRNTLKKAKPY